jgi:hypothetical protein
MVLAASDRQLAGRYRLCRWLAAGGMGQVWQAVDEVLGRPVAVKLLRDEYTQDPSFVRRLRAEARYGAAVTHPGVAGVYDYGEVTGAAGAELTAVVVMELVEGEPLSSLLARKGRLGWTGAWGSSGRRRWRLGRRIGLGWCTGHQAGQPACLPGRHGEGDRRWRGPGARPGPTGSAGAHAGHGGLPVA